jgi:hypothetical protein
MNGVYVLGSPKDGSTPVSGAVLDRRVCLVSEQKNISDHTAAVPSQTGCKNSPASIAACMGNAFGGLKLRDSLFTPEEGGQNRRGSEWMMVGERKRTGPIRAGGEEVDDSRAMVTATCCQAR